jgi:hypothetical protein
MSAAFLCAETGTDNDATMINTAAYLQSWLGALKDDKTMIVFAASRAQKSADYILGHSKLDDCGPIPPSPEGESLPSAPVKKPKTPQISPVEIDGKEITSPLGMPTTAATPGSVESQEKDAPIVAAPVTTTWKRRKNKPVKRDKPIAPVTEVVRITPPIVEPSPPTLEPVTWQSYRDIDKDALPWDGTDVVRWRANRSSGTSTIRVIPTVHEGKYKGSTRIKLNAGVDWGKGVPYLSNPAKIFDNPRFVDIPPSKRQIN